MAQNGENRPSNIGNEPFNPPSVTITKSTQVILDRARDRAQNRMPGTGGHPNPGAVPNMAALMDQIRGFMLAAEGVRILNKANRALFEESKRLECNKPFDYNILIGTSPPQFKGIAQKAEHLLLTTDTEVISTTIIGTNCPQYQLPETDWQREQLEEIIRKHKYQNKTEANK